MILNLLYGGNMRDIEKRYEREEKAQMLHFGPGTQIHDADFVDWMIKSLDTIPSLIIKIKKATVK